MAADMTLWESLSGTISILMPDVTRASRIGLILFDTHYKVLAYENIVPLSEYAIV